MLLAVQLPVFQWQATHRPGAVVLAVPCQLLGISLARAGFHPAMLPGCLALALLSAALPWPGAWPRAWRTPAILPAPGLASHRSPWVNLFIVNIRFLLDERQRRKHWILLLIAPLPVMLLTLCREAQIRPRPTLLIVTLAIVPLVYQVASWMFDLRRMHEPSRGMLRAMGWRPAGTFMLNLALLELMYALLALPLSAALYALTCSLAALYVYPVGMAAVMVFAWFNQRADHQLFLPKVAVATASCWLLITLIPF